MGLDATVYKSWPNVLALGVDADDLLRDEEIGQIYFADASVGQAHSSLNLEAATHRIGNIALVGYLRSEASKILSVDSIVLGKILYNGSHCGDFIPLIENDRLEDELNVMARRKKVSVEWQEFDEKIRSLIKASREENNPIVF